MEEICLKDRNIMLSDVVTMAGIGTITKAILDINSDDDEKEAKQVGYERKPIRLYINTPGGSVYDGFGLIGIIEQSKTPIHTICTGKGMSMGLWLTLSGHKRFATKYATFLYHELSAGCYDKLEGIKEDVAEFERVQKISDDYVVSKTKILRSKLEDVRSKKSDWFISAQEALELGIVDELI
jgi:ATP-dependent Clp protease protease subunit